MLSTHATTAEKSCSQPAVGRPPLAHRAGPTSAAAAHSPEATGFLFTRFNMPKTVLGLTVPAVHNRPALALSVSAVGLGMGSIASLASLTSALGPAVASFVAMTVAPLTASAHLSLAGVLMGVVVYCAGALVVAAAAACAVTFVAMQACAVYHAAHMAKYSIAGDQTNLDISTSRLRQQLSSTGLVGLWTSAALMPLSPCSALQSGLVFGMLQSAQGAVQMHLHRSKSPSEA